MIGRADFAILLALTVMLFVPDARAALTRTELGEIALAPVPEARVPAGLAIETDEGRRVDVTADLASKPTVLLPFDPVCRSVCGPAVSVLAAALRETGLRAGEDYRVVLLALGDRDATTARGFVDAQAGLSPGERPTILVGPPEGVRRLAEAVGYRYVSDADNDAVAHPSGLVVLAPDGRVRRALSSVALTPTDLKLALVEAGEGRVGDLGDRLRLLCYGFDAAHGIYTSRVQAFLQLFGLLTIASLGGGIWWLTRRAAARPA